MVSKNKIEKLENKKKTIRNQFINDLINVNDYNVITKEIEKQINLEKDILNEIIYKLTDDKKDYSFNDIKEFISNIKLNWEYLTNKEKHQFLERFVNVIYVEKLNKDLVIKSVEYKS